MAILRGSGKRFRIGLRRLDDYEGQRLVAVDGNLIQLQSALSGFGEAARSLKEENAYEAQPGSRKLREETEGDTYHVGRAYACAFLLLNAAQDHLESMSRLLNHDDLTQYGFPVLGRATIENAGRAAWLLDEGIDANARMGRGLTTWLISLQESFVVAELNGDGATMQRDQQEITSALDSAQSLGFTVGKNRQRQQIVQEESMPSATDLAVLMLPGSGKSTYKFLSAASHGTTYGLLMHYDFKNAAKGKPVRPQLWLPFLASMLGSAGAAYAVSFQRQVESYGWNSEAWNAWSHYALEVFTKAMEPAIPPEWVRSD